MYRYLHKKPTKGQTRAQEDLQLDRLYSKCLQNTVAKHKRAAIVQNGIVTVQQIRYPERVLAWDCVRDRMFDVSGKRFLVVGASGGIGSAISIALSRANAELCISGTRVDALQSVASQCVAGVHVMQCDLLNSAEVDTLVDRAAELMSGIDGVVCSAGIVLDKLSLRITDEDWDKVIAINLSAVFRINKSACRAMLKNAGGRIINISSIVGVTGNVGQANYSASKAGIIGMSKSLALEFASRGITVNCVAPGFIDTPMTAQLSEKQKEHILNNIPMGRMGTPEDISSVVLFLASDASSYITGQTIHVNGGMLMC